MLHALLHGKVDPAVPEPERREDALTSAVFGMLVLLEAWGLIAKWIKVSDWSPPQKASWIAGSGHVLLEARSQMSS